MRIIFFLVISLIVAILGLCTADRYRTARIIDDHRYMVKNRDKMDDFVIPVRSCGILMPQYNPALYGDNYVKSPLSRIAAEYSCCGYPSKEDEYDPKKYAEKNEDYPPAPPSSSSSSSSDWIQPPQQPPPWNTTAIAVGSRPLEQPMPPTTTNSFFGGSINDKRYRGDIIPPMSSSGVQPERTTQAQTSQYPY